MGLKGKMTLEREIKCHGDVFHDLLRHKPHDVANIASDLIHDCDLHDGELGLVGTILVWTYTHAGKKETMKIVVEALDEEKKLVKYQALEGEIFEVYKEYSLTLHVEENGDEKQRVIWTLEYERIRDDAADPASYLALLSKITNDIESHHATTS